MVSSIIVALFTYFQVFGVLRLVAKEPITISREEDLGLDKLLETLNKPGVKTIKNEYGETFDCVDIHKQPSLEHPLLKNHKIKMTPSSHVGKMFDKASGSEHLSPITFKCNCPSNTVPIRRTTKEDLIRTKSFTGKYSSEFDPMQGPGIKTKVDATRIYRGDEAFVTIHKPHVEGDQWSAAVISLQSGNDHIKIGWMAGDKDTGCYNLMCNGFVQTNPNIPLQNVFYTDQMFSYTVFGLYQKNDGNWYMTLLDLDKHNEFEVIGYWPKELFTHLANGAEYIEMGGQVYVSDNNYYPEMGNGRYSDGDYTFTANMYHINFANGSGIPITTDNAFIELHEDHCYTAGDNNYKADNKSLEYSFIYGGSYIPKK